MKNIELKDIDGDDLYDVLLKAEESFGLHFPYTEFENSCTFGDLCDQIKSLIKLNNKEDCTTQQAFYKLRSAISNSLRIDKNNIRPDSKLIDLFPKNIRRDKLKNIENELGFQLGVLRAPHFITNSLILLFFSSILFLIINPQFGLYGIIVSILGFILSIKLGNTLDLNTVGQLSEKITREHYNQSRRSPNTYNEQEIENVLIDLFSKDLDIDKVNLKRESSLI
mgnify:CR=1 FL=1